MILSFRHKGLEAFFLGGSKAGIQGERAGFHAVTVQANWRLVFRFDGDDVELVDYLNYH